MTALPRFTRTAALVALGLALAAPARASLIGYWSFDGCTATDASGNNATLTPHGVTCGAGQRGSGWQLNGVDQYLDRQPDTIFEPRDRAWTVAVWEKSTDAVGYKVLLEWYRCGANPLCNLTDGACYLLALNTGTPDWFVRDDAASGLTVADTSAHVANGQWHHVVATFNPVTDSAKIYVDGARRVGVYIPLSTMSGGFIPLEVGRHFRTGWGQPDYYFNGSIDEVRIYDEELGAAQVAALFGHGTTGVEGGAVAGLAIERNLNPTHGGRLPVSFTLPLDAPAEVALFDIGGRRIAHLGGVRGAGRHEVELGAGHAIAPGFYLIRLTQGAHSAARRVTVIE